MKKLNNNKTKQINNRVGEYRLFSDKCNIGLVIFCSMLGLVLGWMYPDCAMLAMHVSSVMCVIALIALFIVDKCYVKEKKRKVVNIVMEDVYKLINDLEK